MLLTKRFRLKTVFVSRPEYEQFAADLGELLASPLNPHHLVDVVARCSAVRANEWRTPLRRIASFQPNGRMSLRPSLRAQAKPRRDLRVDPLACKRY
jgi:hypothetical protein